jgi:hypothetical protein
VVKEKLSGQEVHESYKESLKIIEYKEGVPLYLDRKYTNEESELSDLGVFLIQMPRHLNGNILIEANQSVKVYRAVYDGQEIPGYEKSGVKLLVEGRSIDLNTLLVKSYEKGLISIPSGVPMVSSPIFIDSIDDSEQLKIILK